MPEGDTLYRTATVLRAAIAGARVVQARGRPGGAQLERVVGSRVAAVRTMGKHLLLDFDSGLTLHTHLQMKGSWHRYRPRERWRRHPSHAVAVIETSHAVAVCFDAPTVELLDSRAIALHPVLGRLGPDLLAETPDIGAAVERLQHPSRAGLTIAEALLDQRAVAGLGNVYRSEILFIERLDPLTPLAEMAAADLTRLLGIGADLLRANVSGGARVTLPAPGGAGLGSPRRGGRGARLWVYGRAGRPCRRCGEIIRSRPLGAFPRTLYWCPRCQGTRIAT